MWDREIGHKLFNFHEGYEALQSFSPIVGSRKWISSALLCIDFFKFLILLLGWLLLDVISRFNKNNVVFNRARDMHPLPISKTLEKRVRRERMEAEKQKLINVMFHDDSYYLHEPFPDEIHKRDPDLIIEKHCWHVVKFMPKMRCEIKWNDVIRFGRVTFKVTELVITPE